MHNLVSALTKKQRSRSKSNATPLLRLCAVGNSEGRLGIAVEVLELFAARPLKGIREYALANSLSLLRLPFISSASSLTSTFFMFSLAQTYCLSYVGFATMKVTSSHSMVLGSVRQHDCAGSWQWCFYCGEHG